MSDPRTTIMIIEDSPTQALKLDHFLQSQGFHTLVTATGREGIRMLQEFNPDLVILDVILPDMDGYSVCRRMRRQMKKYVPVLMLTAKDDIDDRVDGLDVGADDYMIKPFDERELLARLNALLRIKHIQNELTMVLEEERKSKHLLKQIALIDHLTDVFNRHHLNEALQKEFEKAKRYRHPLSVILVDVDHFRDFNTRYGHAVGDWVLQGVAHLLKESVREADIVARYGGDEFVIVAPMTSRNDAVAAADRICKAIGEHDWNSPKGKLNISVSIGVAEYPQNEVESPEHLIGLADKAMYQGKAEGRDRVCVYSAQQDAPRAGAAAPDRDPIANLGQKERP